MLVLLRSLFLLVFFCLRSLFPFLWSFWGCLFLLGFFGGVWFLLVFLLRSLFLLVFLEEFVPFGFGLCLLRSLFLLGLLESSFGFFLFGLSFEEFVPFGFLEEFGCLCGPFEEFVPFGLLERVWSSWSFVSEFAPVPSSVFSTSHEQRLLVEMKLILLKLKL